jgi:RNA polymerase sigma factor (sigma-70 family)
MTNTDPNLEALVQQLLSKHYHALIRWATREFGEFVAEDAVAFAFGQLALGKMQEGHPQPVAWLRTVAKNEALRLLEVQKDKPEIDSLDAIDADALLASPMGDPVLAAELVEKRSLLDQLKPDERTALEDHALGFTYKEIAERHGWTYTKVNRCITEGKAALRRLQKEGS